MQILTITQPDDWHVHLRDGDALINTVSATANHFARALVMPNLIPPLTTLAALNDYRDRIIKAIPLKRNFTPYFSLYLNESVTAATLMEALKPYILGAKLYPAGATTNSAAGVKSLQALYPLLDLMQQNGQVLQIHGEITQGDIFDREALFISEQLQPLIKNFPKLKIVLEHISTRAAVEFVLQSPENIAATITPHHLLYNRNHLLAGGIKPHFYCLPILKKEQDQKILQQAAVSGNPKFFAGTDSAPHSMNTKESACGCAGIYSAPYALSLYATLFDSLDQLDKLNAFMGKFGADFYGLPINKSTITLQKIPQKIPGTLELGKDFVVPIEANGTIPWSVEDD